MEAGWAEALAGTRRPCCRLDGGLVRHGVCRKYHNEEQIEILRVGCRGCGVTHAIMPSLFSPSISIGTDEAERYLKARASGHWRCASGSCVLDKARRDTERSRRVPGTGYTTVSTNPAGFLDVAVAN